jgi:hypothetical protein
MYTINRPERIGYGNLSIDLLPLQRGSEKESDVIQVLDTGAGFYTCPGMPDKALEDPHEVLPRRVKNGSSKLISHQLHFKFKISAFKIIRTLHVGEDLCLDYIRMGKSTIAFKEESWVKRFRVFSLRYLVV